jgi:ELMO/CED-12 family
MGTVSPKHCNCHNSTAAHWIDISAPESRSLHLYRTMSVTGAMLAPTDDSSDSDSDDEVLDSASAQVAVPRLDLSKLISQHADDDDADIEYGDGAVLKRPQTPPAQSCALAAANTAASTAKPIRVNLIDAMAEAVDEIEAELQGRLFVTPASAAASNANATSSSNSPSSNGKMAAAASNPTVQQQPVDGGDAFGIAYRPAARLTSSQQQGYSIPSGPAFADEREFETELSSEFALTPAIAARNDSTISIPSALRANCNDDDDEFEFDDNCAVVPLAVQKPSTFDGTSATVVDINAVQKHLQSAQQLSAIDTTDPLALCDTTVSTPAAAETEPVLNLEMLLKGVQSSTDTASGGLNALDTLKSMYTTADAGAAADDGSCAEMRENAIVDATAETNAVKTECIVSQVIDEGDEDDDVELDVTEPAETAVEVELTEVEQPAHISAADEWSAIEALQQQHNQRSASFNLNSSSSSSTTGDANDVNTATAAAVPASLLRSNISVKEALKQLRQVDMNSYRALIVPTEFTSSKGFPLLQKTPVLRVPNADVQRDEVFLLAQVHYNPEDTLHQRMLQTVYRSFTGNSTEICIPNTGTHWDAIGFQGIDPCTDLNRSQGILSILQVMMFIEQQPEYAAAIHRASAVSGTLGWPFMCVAIGFTKEAVGVLRRGACYTECNACADSNNAVMTVLGQLQQAQFHDFNTRCKAAPSVHHAMHLAKTRECILKTPSKLLKAYTQYLSKSSSSSSGGGASSGSSATTASDSSMLHKKYLSPCDKDSSVSNDGDDNFGSSSSDSVGDTAASVHQRLRAYKV